MYLHFRPCPSEPYVAILCTEACGTVQNLMDKRSRFAPSVISVLAVCPVRCLCMLGSDVPRWELIRLLDRASREDLVLPVRDSLVLFGLRTEEYHSFAQTQTAQPYEFFCPMDTLIPADPRTHEPLRALIGGAALAAILHGTAGRDASEQGLGRPKASDRPEQR